MKTLYTFLLLMFISTLINAQIPGANFETWQTITFEYPQYADWTIYHERTTPDDVGLLEKSSDASDGDYAIKFNTYGTDDFGYIVYGQLEDEGPGGGIPFADDPDQITISYKCNMASGDSATIWVWLSSGGSQITTDNFKVGGTQLTYKDTTFSLSAYTETPDSLMFAIVPIDILVEEIGTDGNEVFFDNVRFSGGTNNLQLPDNSFESWASKTQDYTVEMKYIRALCEKSDDAYSGNFALKMTTQNVRWDDDNDEIDMDNELNLWGKRDWVEVSPDNHEPRIIGGLPVQTRKDTLVFYYIYIPAAGVIDTAEVSLCFDKDSIEVYNHWDILLPTDTYTIFEIPYDLDNAWGNSVEADSMVLTLASSKWRNNWLESDTTIKGSRLYIDYMYFKSQLFSVSATAESNGTVSPADTSIIQGDNLVFTITPDDGYEIDSVSYNGDAIFDDLVQSGNDFTYTENDITEDGSLYVSFKVATERKELILTKDKISIYPNPVTDILYITGTETESMVQFISVTGAVVYQKTISRNSSLDVSHLPAGLYFVKINNKVQCKLFKR